MKIDRIETALYSVPTRRPVGNAIFTYTTFEYITARVYSNGESGFGWSYTAGEGGRAVLTLIDQLKPSLVGREVEDIAAFQAALSHQLKLLEGIVTSLAVAPLDIALWDLKGRCASMPLHELIGAKKTNIRACATGIDLNYTTEELLEEVGEWIDGGFRMIRVKVGKPDPAEDLNRLEAVRERIGPDVALIVDANEAWSLGEAIDRIAMLEHLDLELVEDPLPPADVEGYKHIRNRTGLRLASGERFWSPSAARPLATSGGIDVLRADVSRIGGISGWLSAAELVRKSGILIASHMVEELSLPLSCAVEQSHSLERVPCCALSAAGVVVDQPVVENGIVTPSSSPGHGVVFDLEALESFRVSPREKE